MSPRANRNVELLLDVERAELFGFSLGGLTAMQTAISGADRAGRVVLASAHYRADGYRNEILNPQAHLNSDLLPTEDDFRQMPRAPTRVAPDPAHFGAFMAKASAMVGAFEGWSDDTMRAIDAPTLLIVGDHDFVRLEHAVAMHELIPGSQLAVPGDHPHGRGAMRRDRPADGQTFPCRLRFKLQNPNRQGETSATPATGLRGERGCAAVRRCLRGGRTASPA